MASNELHLKFHGLLSRNLGNRITPELINGLAGALGLAVDEHLTAAAQTQGQAQQPLDRASQKASTAGSAHA